MIDGSQLPLEENIALTRKAVEMARIAGASVEGELGVLGEEDGSDPDETAYAKVEDVERFVAEAGVDALAVAIGNAHGLYKKEPKLDFDRLEAIGQLVDTPLVLHGGTGIPDRDIQRAIKMGITKINIGAAGRIGFMNGLRESLRNLPDEKFPHLIYPKAVEGHSRVIEDKMRLFMSTGKAC